MSKPREPIKCHMFGPDPVAPPYSGRPYGAPSELDAAESLWDLPRHQAATSFQTQSETRKYNLFSVISGPTIGVHFTRTMKTKSNLFPTWTIYSFALAVMGLSLVSITTAASNFTDANWSSMGGFPGVDGPVSSMVVDGAGNLYIAGSFTIVGDVIAPGIAKWDGTSWSGLGTRQFTEVAALAVIGDDIYVGGYIIADDLSSDTFLAKWDGSGWSALGPVMGDILVSVSALAVSGSDLYVGGHFTTVGGVEATNIAKWKTLHRAKRGVKQQHSTFQLQPSGESVNTMSIVIV